jgi:ADP-heptose:LPS heptosyltransferase
VRVLLVRLDGIGDAAVCVPLLAALRGAGHEAGVALTTRNAGLFDPSAILAEHVLERIPWPAHGSTPQSTARASAEIAALRYDVALIASEEPEAFALAAPVARRVGFTTGLARPLKSLWVRARTTATVSRSQRAGRADAHEVEVMYRLGAGLVHEPSPPADPVRLRAVLDAPRRADDGVRDEPDEPDEPRRIVVQAGPKWVASGVPVRVVREAFERLAHRARVVAAPGDAAWVREQTGIEPETFSSLRAWVRALGAASRLVTVDTGAAHVAGMLGVPVVDVFPDRGFDAQVRRWRPWASPYRAFRASDVDGGPRSAFIEAAVDGF